MFDRILAIIIGLLIIAVFLDTGSAFASCSAKYGQLNDRQSKKVQKVLVQAESERYSKEFLNFADKVERSVPHVSYDHVATVVTRLSETESFCRGTNRIDYNEFGKLVVYAIRAGM